jgi:hypothetical protein
MNGGWKIEDGGLRIEDEWGMEDRGMNREDRK